MRIARFKVRGRLDMASKIQEGTVTIDREHGLFMVRPKRRRRVYALLLADVARAVVVQVLFSERQARKRGW